MNLGSRFSDTSPATAERGWTRVDFEDTDIALDLGIFPWPWADGSVHGVLAGHIIEHFPKVGAYRFIQECRRILRPGGLIRIAAPDLDRFIQGRVTGDWSLTGGKPEFSFDHFFGGPLWEDGLPPPGAHLCVYNAESVLYMLRESGFKDERKVECGESKWRMLRNVDTELHRPVSMYLEARRGRRK